MAKRPRSFDYEVDGITGTSSVSAKQAEIDWRDKRDFFVRRSLWHPPHVVIYVGMTLIVYVGPHGLNQWIYSVADHRKLGRAMAVASFSAETFTDAVLVGVTEVAGRLWSVEQPEDDRAFYLAKARLAGVPEEWIGEGFIAAFLRLAAFWRSRDAREASAS